MRFILVSLAVILTFSLPFSPLQTSPVAPPTQPTCPGGNEVENILNQILNSNGKILRDSLHFPNNVKGGYVGKFDLDPTPIKEGYECKYFRKGDTTNPLVKFFFPPRR